MRQYRVKVVLETAEEIAGDYNQLGNYVYTSAGSDWFELVRHMYTALTQVAFYWNMSR